MSASADALSVFREQVREWISLNAPEGIKGPLRTMNDCPWGGRRARFASDDQRLWFERMRNKGWICPEWSRDYGGAGLDADQAKVLSEELAAAGCRPPLSSLGIKMLAPVLFKFGTDAQRATFLPPMARGEIRWCQGYSEPGAGSDLASVQTRAVRDGDHYRVSGSKIWTSNADQSDWIFCLVRTDTDVPKHQGISFLLIDMACEGVSTRPIRLLSGKSVFCETFFDDVRVPAEHLVGEEGQGWTIAKYLLSFERGMIAGAQQSRNQQTDFQQQIAQLPLEAGRDALALRAAELDIEGLATAALVQRGGERLAAGELDGAYASVLKLAVTEQNQRRLELANDIVFARAGAGVRAAEDDALYTEWLRSRANTIEGGSSEIQLNIIARRLLGLPA